MSDEPGAAPPTPQWGTPQPDAPVQPPPPFVPPLDFRGQPGSPILPPPGYPPQGVPYGYYQPPQVYAGPQAGNGLGIAGGVCGIVAVVLCWIPFVDYISIILGALAIIFGALGLRHANAHGGGGKGMAITGIVTGIVALVITILFLAVVYTAVTSINANIGVP